jgi:MFS family permease
MIGTIGNACLLPAAGKLCDRFGSRAAAATDLEHETAHSRREALRTPAFWLFSLGLGLYGLYMTGLTFHIVCIFESSGMTRSQAVMIFLPGSFIAVLTHLGAISGVHMALNVFCSAGGPVLFSQSLTWSGSYRFAALGCAVPALLLLVLSFRLKEPPPVRRAKKKQPRKRERKKTDASFAASLFFAPTRPTHKK